MNQCVEEKERNIIFIYQIPLVIPQTRDSVLEGCKYYNYTYESDDSDHVTHVTHITHGLSQDLTGRLKCISRSFDNAML